MSSDHSSLRMRFSEPPADLPAQTVGHRLPSAEETLFQQPPGFEPELPAQADGRRTGAVGGLTFSAPDPQS